MAQGIYTTSQVAKSVGVHPNTVRLYEQWGLLPVVPRSPAGYRRFTMAHLNQMRLARAALSGLWPGRRIHQSAAALVRRSAGGDLGGALEMAYIHLALVKAELAHAEAAARLLERWAQGAAADSTQELLQIGQVAEMLDISRDALRNWERNGLIQVPRRPHNRYRAYSGAEIGRLRVIRMLRSAGYSMMAILRMLHQLDQGQAHDLRRALDTPRQDEDVFTAMDNWLTSLIEQEQRAAGMIELLEEMIRQSLH
jgi:DNA-binding transcriptional MerR regulator